jgi:alkaline phosphatase
MPVTRRSFIARSGLAAATALAAPSLTRAAESKATRSGDKPRHIIMLISDGMSAGTLTGADHLAQLVRGRELSWMELYRRPGAHQGFMNVRSLDSLVTDSSAASCAWGSGSRIQNGTVNVLPDGRVLKTLYELFGEAGWKRGLVTTTEITHATPAGFVASGLKREAAETIAVQYLERGVDVLLGGGQKFYDAAKRKDKRDLWREYAQAGYAVMKTAAELDAASADRRWLGTFSESHLPFTIDHNASAQLRTTVPTLAAMTRAALKRLRNESHFILQVEGGRVDHGGHTCDAAAAFHDQIAFDEALDVCLEFQREQPDTLLVITTDHGNGNPGLNGTGANYIATPLLFANLKDARCSFGEILKRLGTTPPAKTVQSVVHEATGYQVPADKADWFAAFLAQKAKPLYSSLDTPPAQLGQLLANHWAIGWIGHSHTADYVPILALGPGAQHFGGYLQNTDVFRHFTTLAGIDFKNPSVPLLSAAAPAAGSPEDADSYWREAEPQPV